MSGHDHHTPRRFPEGFLWGTATSSFQVEGGNDKADWHQWEQKGKRIADGTTSGRAVDHWTRWEEDFSLAQETLHNNAYRCSVEWSRVEPEAGVWNEEAFEQYRSMLKSLKDRGMTVMLTLHHFTNPQWLADKGGWERGGVLRHWDRYVQKVCEELGVYVDLWCTINEPLVYISEGYVACTWPPQTRSWTRAARVLWHMSRAHRRAYKRIHAWARGARRSASVGMAHNVSSLHIDRAHSVPDHVMMWMIDALLNHGFYRLSGTRTHDYLGLNYYFHVRIRSWLDVVRRRPTGSKQVEAMSYESSDIGWELFPHGIYNICVDMSGYGKPMYITENGLATDNDDKRVRALIGYLLQVYYACQAGADIRGYFHWSLLDNFEWAKGFAPKFGLVEVDRVTMERRPRASAEIYGTIAHENAIRHELLTFLGHGTSALLKEWKHTHHV